MNMKRTKIFAALAVATGGLVATPAHAGAVASADLYVYALGLFNSANPSDPFGGSITVSNETRRASASAGYNGASIGTGTLFGTNGTVDPGYQCLGNCAAAAALYAGGGGISNNTTTHLSTPGSVNFALGDALIAGTALKTPITGLTRADIVSTSPTNFGGSDAQIQNGANISGSFSLAQTFSGLIGVGADAFLQAWVDLPAVPGSYASADAGYLWNMVITDNNSNVILDFKPSILNRSTNSDTTKSSNPAIISSSGFLYSSLVTFNANQTYKFTITQNSQANLREIPEPESIALVGAALLGLGVASRRRAKK